MHFLPLLILYAATLQCPSISISPTQIADATYGLRYSQRLTVSGGTAPFTYDIESGKLPLGLAISRARSPVFRQVLAAMSSR